ncbi:Canalicular multispecific organic anion transporter [Entamoeba marina]
MDSIPLDDFTVHNVDLTHIDVEPTLEKKHPNILQTLFFRRAPKYISKGRKGGLEVDEIGQIPSTLNINKTYEKISRYWDEECKKHPNKPSLFRTLLKVEWKSLLWCFTVLLFSQLTTLVMPAVIQFLVRWISDEDAETYVGFIYVTIITIFQLFTSFCSQMSVKWIFVLSLRLRNGLISMIYQKSLKLNSASIEETGKLVNLMSNDAFLFVEQLPFVIKGACAPILFIIVIGILGYLIRWFVFIPISVCIIFLFINACAGRLIGVFFGKSQKATDKRLNFFGQILRSIKFIKYNAWESPLSKTLKSLRGKEIFSLGVTASARSALVTIMIELTNVMAFGLFLVMILIEVELDAAIVFSCIGFFNTIRVPFMNFGYFISSATTFSVSIKRLQEYFVTPELTPQDRRLKGHTDNAIEVKDAEFAFPNGERAFSCDDLQIKKGEVVCVLGSVGSGKSSFILSLLGELEKQKGEVTISGNVTYASQSAWLMNTSVRENIIFLEQFNSNKYAEACTAACLDRDLQILRNGDLYEVAERGANLSGGQKQRISIARALYNAKDIVVFDDPLSAVDFQVGGFIFEHAIQKYLAGKTRIIVTNQTYFIDKADRIIVINDRRIDFNGSLSELQQSNIAASDFVKTISNDKNKDKKEVDNVVVPQDVVASEMVNEKREVGGVSFNTYFQYHKAGGLFFFAVLSIPFGLRLGFRVCYNLFVTFWTNGISDTNPQGDTFWFYAANIALLLAIISTLSSMIGINIFGLRASNNLHWMMANNLFKTLLSFFDVTPIGRLLNFFSKDLRFVDFRMPLQYEQFLGQTLGLIAILVAICMVSYYLIIVIVVVLVVFFLFNRYFIKSSIEMQRLEGITRSPMFIHFDQTLLGLSTIRLYSGEKTFLDSVLKKMKNNTLAYYTLQIAKSWYSQRLDWLGIFVTIITTILMVVLKITSGIDVGIAGTALVNIAALGGFISGYSQSIIELDIVMQSTERVLELRHIPIEETHEKKKKSVEPPANWPTKGEIRLENFSFRYREKLPLVLKNVTATIGDLEKIGIVGRTGSGKSTLMAGLFRIEEPAEGTIYVDNIDITTVPMKTLRKRLCILPQEATMFSGTIRDNLDPELTYSDEEMLRVLKLVNVNKQLDDVVMENGENFSLGERQMICMARALLRNSKVLIMDEATASIDIQTDVLIQEMVRKNFTDCTVLTIAHRLHSIMDSNKVMVFDDGSLKEMDTPLNLIDRETTIFNNLVEQSGVKDELKRLALGDLSIADTLRRDIKDSSDTESNNDGLVVNELGIDQDVDDITNKIAVNLVPTTSPSVQIEQQTITSNKKATKNKDLDFKSQEDVNEATTSTSSS